MSIFSYRQKRRMRDVHLRVRQEGRRVFCPVAMEPRARAPAQPHVRVKTPSKPEPGTVANVRRRRLLSRSIHHDVVLIGESGNQTCSLKATTWMIRNDNHCIYWTVALAVMKDVSIWNHSMRLAFTVQMLVIRRIAWLPFKIKLSYLFHPSTGFICILERYILILI